MKSASADGSAAALEVRHLSRKYTSRHSPDVVALDDVSLRIERGEFVAIVGPSGGGKSTLLNMLGLLDFPDSGDYLLDGQLLPNKEGRSAARIRSTAFAFIFQSFHLLQTRPVKDSVELGLMYRGVKSRIRPAVAALSKVGLANRSEERSSHLSGGQQQRVAIARAIASDARIVFADEPTGNLDSENAHRIVNELIALNRAGATVVVVTHSEDVAAVASRQLHIQDGRLVSDTRAQADQVRSDNHAFHGPSARDNSRARTPSVQEDRSILDGLLPDPLTDEADDSITHAPPAKERHPRLRSSDILRDAWRSVRSRPAQTFALCLAVAIAVALTLTTLGISTSAQAQVSAAFDAQLNREVSATWENAADSRAAPLAEVPERTSRLAGVDAAAAVGDFDPVNVSGVSSGRAIQPHSFSGDLEGAARLTIQKPAWRAPGPLNSSEVLLGAQLASQLELAPLDSGPTVSVDGRSYQVAGIIQDSPRLPLLRGELLVSADSPGFSKPKTMRAILLTAAGAAQQVAAQAPIAINPYLPNAIAVQAPTNATELRVTIEQGVQTTLIVFTILAIIVAIAALANAMLLAVTARRGEIGMRKALGARSSHVAWLLAGESAYIGVAGGILGLVTGMFAILTITLSQHWAPVFDLRLGPLAVVAGILIGMLGGVTAAIRAARIRPAESLRL